MDYGDETALCDPSGIRRRFSGYDCDEVDRRLDRLLQIIVDGRQVRKMQEGTIRTLEAQIDDYRESQALVRALFARAEDEAKEIVKRAGEQAEGILERARDVEERAAAQLAEAGSQAAAIRAEAEQYAEQKKAQVEREAEDALRAVAFAENFEKIIGKPEIGGLAGEVLGRHILMFLSELSEVAKDAAVREKDEG